VLGLDRAFLRRAGVHRGRREKHEQGRNGDGSGECERTLLHCAAPEKDY
jgi:hypothetical protein